MHFKVHHIAVKEWGKVKVAGANIFVYIFGTRVATSFTKQKSNLGQIMKCNKENWELIQVNS